VSIQAQILNLINELKNTFKFTSLFISHDLSVIHYISDRILVLKDGKIVESGNAEDIFTNPTNDYTKSLLNARTGKKLQLINI
jgi:peptide/nickel transport system ATP-binding protein